MHHLFGGNVTTLKVLAPEMQTYDRHGRRSDTYTNSASSGREAPLNVY